MELMKLCKYCKAKVKTLKLDVK